MTYEVESLEDKPAKKGSRTQGFLLLENVRSQQIVFAILLVLSLALVISLPVKDFIASEFGQTIRGGTLQWIVGFSAVALPVVTLILSLLILTVMWIRSKYILGLKKMTIHSGQAVVLEQGGEVSRIEGPGVITTRRGEVIKAIVDLKPQFALREVENVLTRDRVPLKITLGIGFQIESKQDIDARLENHTPSDGEAPSRLVSKDPYPVYEATIRKAVYNVTEAGWQSTVCGASESIIRDIIMTYDLDQIFDLSGTPTTGGFFTTGQRTIAQIEQRANEVLEEVCLRWGVKYGGVDLRVIEMPDKVHERMLEVWETEWKSRIQLREATAERISRVEKQKAEIWAQGTARVKGTKGEKPTRDKEMRCFKTGSPVCPKNPVLDPHQVFIGMPFRPEFADSYKYGVVPALEAVELYPWRASDAISNIDIMCKVCEGIQSSRYAVINVSDWNPNVLFELGLTYGLRKETVIVKDKRSQVPTDLAGMEYIEYSSSDELREKLIKFFRWKMSQ